MMRNWHLNLLRTVTRLDFIRQASTRSMAGIKRIAVCQMTSVADKAANMEVVSSLISKAVKEDVQRNVIEVEILTGCGDGDTVFIARIPLIPHNYQFKRMQLSGSVYFAINKSQGPIPKADGCWCQPQDKLLLTWTTMLFFPEACDYLCDNKNDTLKLAEPIIGGATVSGYRKLAAKHNVWLSMGGVHEKDEEYPSKTCNTHIIIDNKGNIVQTYRKLHLFDVEIPERNVRLKESDFCMPGNHIVAPVDTPIGKVGLGICYDMRFSELSTSLSIMKAEVLTYPSAFTQHTGAAHWHVLLRARAIENQCYVIAAAQSGTHNAKRKSYGHAICIDPWGEVLADCEEESPCYKVVEISEEKLNDVRRNMPVFQHRRRNVYSLYCLSVRKNLLPTHIEASDLPPDTLSASSPESHGVSPDEPCYDFGHVKIPETCVFFKSQLSYAFVNLRCVIPGHVLVAPIRMAERNRDLSEEEAQDFYKSIRTVQKLMERVHAADSCTVTIQDGREAGQTVRHLHCHIMPRKKGDFIENDLIYLELAKHDQFKSGHPSKPPRTREEMIEEATLLKSEYQKMVAEGSS